jgi:hypothetical protein
MDRGFLPDCHQDSIGSIGQKFTGMVLGRCRPPIANREGVEVLAGASGSKVGPKQEKKSANIYIYIVYMGKYESESYVVILDVILLDY